VAAKKGSVKQEPLLNTVARKLGHAAGRLTKVTHKLTENFSSLPETVVAQVREAAHVAVPSKGSRSSTRHPEKKTRKAAGRQRVKAASGVVRKSSTGKTHRRGSKPANTK